MFKVYEVWQLESLRDVLGVKCVQQSRGAFRVFGIAIPSWVDERGAILSPSCGTQVAKLGPGAPRVISG